MSLKNFNWGLGGFIIGYQAILLVALPFYLYYTPPHYPVVLASIVLFVLTSFGVGVYHRHYSHLGYKLNRWIEPLFLFFGTAAFQGSVIMWAHDHRKHHRFIDTDEDPYTVSKGFWHAHMLWLLEKSRPRELERYVPDLLKRKLLVFQDKHYLALSIAINTLLCIAVGAIVNDYLGAFVLAWWGRIFVSHHVTWFINSLAHYWGERTYSKELSAVDNFILAFFTSGEGYHNYHHTFPADYRNGVRWYHFDPNKWLVWALSKLGLAKGLLRHTEYTIQQKLLLADQKLFLTTLATQPLTRKQELEARLHTLYVSLQEKMERMKTLRDERRAAFKARRKKLSYALREIKRTARKEWRQWHKLGRSILDAQEL
ncbi:MAG: fatty acid desaturase [Candidatus Komeilibacteria bacterium]|nr:fatty acid desaturase [Candidatus Komeilibacteria bacterium]